MSPILVVIAIALYIALLFWLAKLGDKSGYSDKSWVRHPLIYSLALGVYCTSWTFYGLVGTASVSVWDFLPILLGPVLIFIFGFKLFEHIDDVCRQEHIHSIADFMASRYGKRQGIAATTTLVVLLATIPYIALQLKAVSDTLALILKTQQIVNQDITLFIAGSMIAFALTFGARRLDVSGYHSGLVMAIAFESFIKLLALIALALFALIWFNAIPLSELAFDYGMAKEIFHGTPVTLRFFTETVLSACAILCLPRMFHVTFVECLSKKHLRTARFVFPMYLTFIAVCILIIAVVGNQVFAGQSIPGDTFVISLPLSQNVPALSLVAFLGGFSAATAMIIVATITLSQMLSNDVVLPLLLRRQQQPVKHRDYSRALIFSRRATVVLVVVLAYIYQAVLAENVALTSIGLIAFALVVQMAPAMILALYWRSANASGVYAGLSAGLVFWFYTLMVPLLAAAGVISPAIVEHGLFGMAWLRPEELFGLTVSDTFTRGALSSLIANIAALVLVSKLNKTNLSDRIQACAFTARKKLKSDTNGDYKNISVDDLRILLNQFLGQTLTEKLFRDFSGDMKKGLSNELAEYSLQALAGVVGVASSHAMIDSLRRGENLAVEDVVNIFEETTRALRFNQDILFASFENMSSAISVVNKDLKMVAWNRRYEEMFNYPKGMLRVGIPVADLVRFNAQRGLLGAGDIEEKVQQRLSHLLIGKPYRVVRNPGDGVVIEIKGTPLPVGGYVTTYDDITEFIQTQRELEQANIHLEKRVNERTKTIGNINENLRGEIELRKRVEQELIQAKAMAEEANATKSRFLALASHDILQPLNAAGLYASALLDSDEIDTQVRETTKKIDDAIHSAESIISILLEVAKLDTGALQPQKTVFPLAPLLSSLIDEIQVQTGPDVQVRMVNTGIYVETDKNYLRRILQNFLSNALKYTKRGKILVGCRRRRENVEICVCDTGPGISEADQKRIFDDFYRVAGHQDIPGIGLGLAVAWRFNQLLGHKIRVRSELQAGSCFSVVLPMIQSPVETEDVVDNSIKGDLTGLRVMYVDDQLENLEATKVLLERWGCEVTTASGKKDAIEMAEKLPNPQILLMDYQLSKNDDNGIQLAKEMRAIWKEDIATCIVSAAADPDLPVIAKKNGFDFLRKPVIPGKLRALLGQTVLRQRAFDKRRRKKQQ
jgi:Na+/proline symporter/signal transduction histidine kinase/CheY-like chemotaxis protein